MTPRRGAAAAPAATDGATRSRAPALARLRWRRFWDRAARTIVTIGTIAAVLPLAALCWHIVQHGGAALSWNFFTALPAPVGDTGGGMANAIVGSLMMVTMASVVAIPLGLGAGLYAAEHRGEPLAIVVRFVADILGGVPSIVIGVLAWELVVRPMGHFSAIAGALALAVIMLPLVARSTEELVTLVPSALFETALSLGYSRWRAALTVVLRTALPGVVTAVLVAVARVAGETAPLLFTAFGNQYWALAPTEPTSALPLQIYTYAISPYDDWRSMAWAGALVLLVVALVLNLISHLVMRGRHRGR